eukprot:6214154-Pleurochrysis_carterae.AAC.2
MGAGWGAPARWLWVRGALRLGLPSRNGNSRSWGAGRSPRVRMRCKCKLGNHAYECKTANERRARQQFISIYRARARVELLIIGSRGQNAR